MFTLYTSEGVALCLKTKNVELLVSQGFEFQVRCFLLILEELELLKVSEPIHLWHCIFSHPGDEGTVNDVPVLCHKRDQARITLYTTPTEPSKPQTQPAGFSQTIFISIAFTSNKLHKT